MNLQSGCCLYSSSVLCAGVVCWCLQAVVVLSRTGLRVIMALCGMGPLCVQGTEFGAFGGS